MLGMACVFLLGASRSSYLPKVMAVKSQRRTSACTPIREARILSLMGTGELLDISLEEVWMLSHNGRHTTTSVLKALALLQFIKWIPDSNLCIERKERFESGILER